MMRVSNLIAFAIGKYGKHIHMKNTQSEFISNNVEFLSYTWLASAHNNPSKSGSLLFYFDIHQFGLFCQRFDILDEHFELEFLRVYCLLSLE